LFLCKSEDPLKHFLVSMDRRIPTTKRSEGVRN